MWPTVDRIWQKSEWSDELLWIASYTYPNCFKTHDLSHINNWDVQMVQSTLPTTDTGKEMIKNN